MKVTGDISDPIELARRRFGVEFKKKSAKEAAGPCPFCKAGVDRFVIFSDGGYWCRQCGTKGWLDEKDGMKLSKIDLLELRVAALERKQKEQDARLVVLERMARCRDHLTYHGFIDDQIREYWHGEGINDASIDYYLLGWCPQCPTDSLHRPSYTIPIVNRGRLENIRHRLVGETKDKYRPHMAGLGSQLFNLDMLDIAQNEVLIVEGEKKSVVLAQNCIENVGICGARTFKYEWIPEFDKFSIVYIALDPDATESAVTLGKLFPGRARIVSLPVKPDDFFVKYGGTVRQFYEFVHVARPIPSDRNAPQGSFVPQSA